MLNRLCCKSMAALILALVSGCASPYYADRGALFGGLTGAGVGALAGNAVGHTGTGALVGAGVGAVSGAAIGSGLDEVEAKNRAMIEARMRRPIPAGQVTFNDVIAMTRAQVDEELIINHIRANGSARPVQTGDLITLQQQGVSKRVIEALQAPPAPSVVVREAGPPPVFVEETYWGPPPYYYRPYAPPPRFGWGFSYGGGPCY